MIANDRNYLSLRAEVEFDRARRASHPKAAAAHRQLAQAYLDRVGTEPARR